MIVDVRLFEVEGTENQDPAIPPERPKPPKKPGIPDSEPED